MIPLLHNVPSVYYEYIVRIPDSGQPVGDHQSGPVCHKPVHPMLNMFLRPGIHRAGGLIQNEDLIVRQDGSGNG